MVRQSKQTPDQKRDAHKKKTQQDKPLPKKPSDSTVWPCRINGCNKQFAREADLKRHQRTTKLHSVPGFACPQCDARFTRTDALRRHQKSRHNGVVIEPTDALDGRPSTVDDEDPHSSGSRSKSRSRTPSSKEDPTSASLPPSAVPPGGPQSYYRQHTFPCVMIPPPGVMVDGHYPSAVGLPTSAARLHQASWQHAPPWGGDTSQPPPHHMIHPGYPHPYYNVPPQYYRAGAMIHPPPDSVAYQASNGVSSSSNDESSSSRQSSPVLAVDPSLDHSGTEDPSETGDVDTAMIDPLLVSPPGSSADIFNMVDGDSSTDGPRIPEGRSSRGSRQHTSSSCSGEPPNEDGDNTDSETTIVHDLLSPGGGHSYSTPHSLERPPEMEQILTEDGEPMLNPAELLTQVSTTNATSTVLDLMLQILRQESLASPPPS